MNIVLLIKFSSIAMVRESCVSATPDFSSMILNCYYEIIMTNTEMNLNAQLCCNMMNVSQIRFPSSCTTNFQHLFSFIFCGHCLLLSQILGQVRANHSWMNTKKMRKKIFEIKYRLLSHRNETLCVTFVRISVNFYYAYLQIVESYIKKSMLAIFAKLHFYLKTPYHKYLKLL